jgi:hypothetical protein
MSDRYKIKQGSHYGQAYYEVIDTTIPEGARGRSVVISDYKIEAQNHINKLLGLPKELTREQSKARIAELEAHVLELESRIAELEDKHK